MAGKTIPATKAELARLRSRLNAATYRHSLFKNRFDDLTSQLSELARKACDTRALVEKGLSCAHRAMAVASALLSPAALEQALLYRARHIEVDVILRDILTVSVPEYRLDSDSADSKLPYAFAQTSGELDDALAAFERVFTDMLELAQAEKSIQLLSVEIETTKRSANALERAIIPKLKANITRVSARLEARSLIHM